MKLTCDLCGGQLMVGSGGQSASCTVCGLLYSMERLREKLGIIPAPAVEPPIPTPPAKNTVKVKIAKKPSIPAPVVDIPAEPELPIEDDSTDVLLPPILREEPPVAEPPVVEPPVVEPPVEEPPVIEPPVEEPPVVEPPVEEPPVEEPPVVEPSVEEPPAEEPPVVEPPVIEAPVPAGIPAPRIPVSYWIPPMEPPIAPLFAMELRGVSFSTIRGTVLSGTVARGSQILLGSSVCSVISCKPAQLTPGTYAELTISNCPSRAALKKLVYVVGYSSELGQLEANAQDYPGSTKAYMTRILQAAFSDHQIQVTNAPTPMDPVTFTFHQYGQKRLVVILCHGSRYESQPVLQLMDQCQQEGIPCLRFFENFRNNREYIIGRIRKTLVG